MAQLGRGQPFRPLFRPAVQAEETIITAGPPPANVAVAAPTGNVSVTTAGPPAASVSVQAFVGTVSVTTAGPAPANVAVAAIFGNAVTGAVVSGPVVNVAVAAPMGKASVTTHGAVATGTVAAPTGQASSTTVGLTANVAATAPGPNQTTNPFGAGASTTGWTGFNGTLTASTSPPSGCPFSSAFQYVNNGVTSGAIEQATANKWAALPSTSYTVSAWVYTSFGSVQIGFDSRNSAGSFLSSQTTVITVPVNTWTFVTATSTSDPSAAFGVTRVGAQSSSGETIWATGIQTWGLSLPGAASVSTPGPVAPSVTVAAPTGSPGVSLGIAAAVAVRAWPGTASVTTPGPAAANVSVAAPAGSAHSIANVIVHGLAAAVTVRAPAGGAGGGVTAPPAGVAVQAYFGKVSVSAAMPGSHVSVSAPVGHASTSVAGQTAHATIAAPAGHVTTTVTAPSASVSAAASVGHASTSVAGHVAVVAARAPAGTVGTTVAGPVAGVTALALPGVVGVSATASANCTLAAHRGNVSVSTPGRVAGVAVMAPVSPFVVALYPVNAQATMEFGAWGSSRRRVWFGYGVVNSLNVQTKPPGE